VYGVGVPADVAVVVDIGGGSVEITRGAGMQADVGRSFKLGVIRITERFVKTDPLDPRDERKLVKHIHAELGEYLDEIAAAGYERVIGTSGTILSLGAIAAAERGSPRGSPLRNRRVSAKRLRVPGLEPRRADLAVAGAILLDTIVKRLGASEIVLCDLSLREGLVLDYIARHRKQIVQADRYPDVRRRSVIELAERCTYWPAHATQIARLSVALFDQTRGMHGLSDREREWLEYAAILHDIGVHISYERHHKHSYYLIKNGDLRGFEPDEIETIALVARYHRQATPKKRHGALDDFSKRRRRTIGTLAAILRLAESLDRSHAQTISSVEFHDRGDDGLLQVRTTGDAELEVWAATRQAAPFERLIGKPLRIEVSGQAYVEQPHEASRVSGQAVRRRRNRRLGKDHAAGAAGEVAERRRASRVRHGMELVRTREGGDQVRKEEERPDADDVQPPARDGLR
jgi:exopolyphosphatase/guanosine-5'-triphosphate,3'-diphosphate pyrophosphatase